MSIKEAHCPECDYRLKLGARPHKGQRVVCPGCETRLTIVSLSPLELDAMVPGNYPPPSKKKMRTPEAFCPICDDLIKLNTHTHQGYRVKCNRCSTLLEVVSTNPLELDVALK